MDAELVKQIVTVTGPMGLLAYFMFRHHTLAMQANAATLVELVKERKDERDQMIAVVKENSTAVAALVERLSHVRVDDLRH